VSVSPLRVPSLFNTDDVTMGFVATRSLLTLWRYGTILEWLL
jgi:hypothetical protein